jgi:hypothetical protein
MLWVIAVKAIKASGKEILCDRAYFSTSSTAKPLIVEECRIVECLRLRYHTLEFFKTIRYFAVSDFDTIRYSFSRQFVILQSNSSI